MRPGRACVCVITAIVWMQASWLWAAAGSTLILPARNVRPKSRLLLQLDTRWPTSAGIVPARLQLRPIGSRVFPADRTLQVTICTKSWNRIRPVAEVVQTIQVSEGEGEASTNVYLPTDAQTHYFTLTIRENGRLLRDLYTESAAFSNMGYYWESGVPRVLIVDQDTSSINARSGPASVPKGSAAAAGSVPNLRQMISWLGQPINYGGGQLDTTNLNWLQLSEMTANVEYLPGSDLPEDIVGLASIDLVLMDLEELHELAQTHAARFEVLRNWLLSGGNLCVSGAGESYEQLESLERLLRVTPATAPQEWFSAQELIRLALERRVGRRDNEDPESAMTADEIGGLVGPTSYREEWWFPRREVYRDVNLNIQNSRKRSGTASVSLDLRELPDSPSFAMRRAHMGTIVAFRGEFGDQTEESWNWLINSLPRSSVDWENRFGLSLASGNDGYWEWMIPGVGLPPVTAFHALLTLFVLAIGPLNYFLLQHYRKLNWLLATVPLGAAVTVLALIAFALVTDGLSARGRVRSWTHIDQRTGDIASWSRQSYYAGLAPSGGLSFPRDAFVFPIDPMPASQASAFAGSRRVQQWNGDQVDYRFGYFPSRTTVQFAVALAGQSTKGIQVTGTHATRGQARVPGVVNQLGARASLVVVRAHDGLLYEAEDLDQGQTVRLKSIDEVVLARRMREVFRDHALSPPPGFDRTLMRNGMFGRRGGSRGVSNRNGILEIALDRLASGHGVIDQPDSYVAIVDRSIHTPLGLKSFVESESLYVVTGRLPPVEFLWTPESAQSPP